ncbi:vascular endothelial growth factor receptor 1 isoform 1 precursor [Silurus asotus]|uniref:receptor protein-tyrosine kinase n=1 Tax=Silurus asotus TaxID=30991 RepID=A0AAD5FTG1_SILAS|nr:vascular endothelial growth factor receptor 1 isoform 1 precursor [Silurus asotus]
MLEIFLVMLCGLTSRGMTKDADNKGRFSSPVLDVTERQITLEKNQMVQLNCRGRWELEWVLPSGVSKNQVSAQVEETRCGKRANHYCSRLTLSPALAQHTGSYRCRYLHKKRKHTSVYVFIADSQQPFVKVQKEIPDVVYMKEGEDLVFPCRVTNPDSKVSLVKFPDRRLGTDQRNIIWNNRKGFVIRSPTYFYIGLFSCETIINGTKFTNKFLTYRPVNKIQQVYLNSTGLVQALQGERLALNCTVTAEWNSRVKINWSYPGKGNSSVSISRRITQSKTNVVFYSILTVHKLHKADKGLYTCYVTSGPAKREVNTSVIVYDQPFITLKHKDGSLVHAHAGQKSFRLFPKLRAFPEPEIVWLKDGMVAAEQCSRYHVDGYSLVIRDVAEEDAGVYTILTRIQQFGLYRNLTLSLVVNVKPQIGEKAVAVRDTATVPRFSRQAFRCTAHGVPRPQIQWLWHRCPSKGLCKEPASSSSWTAVREQTAVTSTHNPVLSVTHMWEVLQGRNKTVGILTIGKALISGVYRCVASNSMGTDELDIRFYVTDVQGGFSISGESEEGPREGRDYHLSCVANKHLYSNMSWHRVTGSSASMVEGPPLAGKLTEGEYSLTLRLTLTNLTAQDSGTYRCSATHLVTGQPSHQEALVTVAVLEAPALLQNLSDCSVNISNSVTLQCPATGVPRPLITWYKDQRKLKQVSGIILSPEDGTLHIDRITVEDEGLYTCEAANERGSVGSSAYISVENSESFSLEIPTLACTCVVATLFWLLLTLLIRKLRQPNSTNSKTEYLPIILHQGEGPFGEHCERLQYDAEKWEFPQERLQLEKPLGRGAFGKVMQASAFGISNSTGCTTVAVKMLKEGATASEHKALMTELKILNHIGHHLNVVNLLGACTRPGGPLMVIVEYCKYGNLSSYLRSKRDVFMLNRVKGEEDRRQQDECKSCVESQNCQKVTSELEGEGKEENENDGLISWSNTPLHLEDLISYSFQVARGMEFLTSRKCIHRDLAARNILLSENNVVKICDFGLARDVYKDPDYVRKGDARLPLKWMAPESIFDKVFTSQSDVWSYGVLLWEIFSLGASPYPGLNIDEEFCHRLKQGTRMRAPEYSTPDIYNTMLLCWERNPSDRPTFPELVGTLGDLLQARVKQDGKDYIPLNMFSEEGGAELLDYRDTHQGSPSYINTRNVIATFEEDLKREVPEDSQTDSGMVLPSEEFVQLKWTDKLKTKKITRFFLKSQHHKRTLCTSALPCVSGVPCGRVENDGNATVPCGSPPPDYNTALFFSSL